MEIVEFANRHTYARAAKRYNVAVGSIYRWRQLVTDVPGVKLKLYPSLPKDHGLKVCANEPEVSFRDSLIVKKEVTMALLLLLQLIILFKVS